jgi:predicted MFS family arabinose efflux permease
VTLVFETDTIAHASPAWAAASAPVCVWAADVGWSAQVEIWLRRREREGAPAAATSALRLLMGAGPEDPIPQARPPASVPAAPAPTGLPWIVFLFVLIAAAANLLFGYENSMPASAVVDYMPPITHNTTAADASAQGLQTSFLKGALALGATVACPFAGFAQDGLGRRVTLILCCLIYMGTAAVTATAASYAAGGFAQVAAGRLLTGAVIGVFSSTVPMYIAELSPPALRGVERGGLWTPRSCLRTARQAPEGFSGILKRKSMNMDDEGGSEGEKEGE